MTPDAAALIRNYPFLKSVLSQQTPCKDATHDRRMTARRGTMVCHRTKMHQRIGSVACCVTVMICCVCHWVKQLMSFSLDAKGVASTPKPCPSERNSNGDILARGWPTTQNHTVVNTTLKRDGPAPQSHTFVDGAAVKVLLQWEGSSPQGTMPKWTKQRLRLACRQRRQ